MAAERKAGEKVCAELEKEREALKEVTASRDALRGQLEDKGRELEAEKSAHAEAKVELAVMCDAM